MTRFISYSSDDRVTDLVATLRRHGMATWRDQDSLRSGQATRSEIEAELDRCDAALVWLGGKTLESDYVCRVELPAIVAAHQERGMQIVPLFVDAAPGVGINGVRSATGLEIGDHNGLVKGDTETLSAFLDRVAQAEARAHLQTRADGRRPTIRMVTRSDVAGARDAYLNFDWIREYPSAGELPDGPTTAVLEQALHRSIQELLAAFGPGTVDLNLKCHLHLGVAIGFELRRVTGVVPRVAAGDGWWTCMTASDDAVPALVDVRTPGPVDGTRSAIELSLSRDVGTAVSDHIAATGIHYRQRIRLAPEAGPGQESVTAGSVNGWAEQAAEVARHARTEPGVEGIDLFLAAPLRFAVALGWRLNAVGGVRIFHPENNAGRYLHVWSLPRS